MSTKDDVFVPVESQALLRTTSLLGEKFIELRPLDHDDPMAGTDLADGDVIAATATAHEPEFVPEQAVQILRAVVSSDVATLVQPGVVGFGGRHAEPTIQEERRVGTVGVRKGRSRGAPGNSKTRQ